MAAATIDYSQLREMRGLAVEPLFNVIIRKLQGEYAQRLCTAWRLSVHSYPFNRSKKDISVALIHGVWAV
jgi:hypothetical protein